MVISGDTVWDRKEVNRREIQKGDKVYGRERESREIKG